MRYTHSIHLSACTFHWDMSKHNYYRHTVSMLLNGIGIGAKRIHFTATPCKIKAFYLHHHGADTVQERFKPIHIIQHLAMFWTIFVFVAGTSKHRGAVLFSSVVERVSLKPNQWISPCLEIRNTVQTGIWIWAMLLCGRFQVK